MSSESPNAILYDYLGNELAVQNGTAIPANTPLLMVGGSDGTNSRYVLVDSSGRQVTVGAGTAGSPTGGVISSQVPDNTATGALGALNATVIITVAGAQTTGFQLAAGTLIGTIVTEVSFDGGTTWNATYFDIGNKVSSIVFASSNTATAGTLVGEGGSGQVRVRVSAYTSGTANITLRSSQVNDPSVLFAGTPGTTSQPPTATQIAGWDNATTTFRVPAVKASTTAAAASDQALVVVVSPNQTTIPVSVTTSNSSTPNLVWGDIVLSSSGVTSQINRTTYTEQTVNFTGSVKSSSANDTAAGTGARTITIYYVDQTGATAGTETATLNGTTAVNLVTTTKCFIEKIVVNTVGSGGVPAGIISLFTGTGGTGTTVGTIQAGDNRTYWCHHYVVTGKTCNITNVSHSNNSTVSGGASTGFVRALPLNSAGAAEINVTEFIQVPGAGPPSVKAYVSTVQVAGPARVTMYVLTSASASTTYQGSIDCYDQ